MNSLGVLNEFSRISDRVLAELVTSERALNEYRGSSEWIQKKFGMSCEQNMNGI